MKFTFSFLLLLYFIKKKLDVEILIFLGLWIIYKKGKGKESKLCKKKIIKKEYLDRKISEILKKIFEKKSTKVFNK